MKLRILARIVFVVALFLGISEVADAQRYHRGYRRGGYYHAPHRHYRPRPRAVVVVPAPPPRRYYSRRPYYRRGYYARPRYYNRGYYHPRPRHYHHRYHRY
jgi:hypothetical protein